MQRYWGSPQARPASCRWTALACDRPDVALYHLSVKTVARSAGRSATAAAAYRSASMIECEREGLVHDYSRRRGVTHSEIIVPAHAAWACDRTALWNAAELAEKRVNSTVAREYEVALPAELSVAGRVELVRSFAHDLSKRYGIAVDLAIHAPNQRGDQRNWHAHVLTTTRVVTDEGLGAKTRVLDDRRTGPLEVTQLREAWADLTNRYLAQEQCADRVDHRSLAAQREEQLVRAEAFEAAGQDAAALEAQVAAEVLDRTPQVHMGVAATAMERWAAHDACEDGREPEPVTDLGTMRAAAQAERAERMRFVQIAREALQELWARVQAAYEKMEALVQALRARPTEIVPDREAEPDERRDVQMMAPAAEKAEPSLQRTEPAVPADGLAGRLEALRERQRAAAQAEKPEIPEGLSEILAAGRQELERERLLAQGRSALDAIRAELAREADAKREQAERDAADREKHSPQATRQIDDEDVARERGPSMKM